MKKTSIFLWITLIFLLAFAGIGGSYMLWLKYIKATAKNQLEKRFDFISQSLIWQLGSIQNPKTLFEELEKLDFIPITHPKEIITIAKHSKIIKRTRYPIGEVIILHYKGSYYIWVQSYGNMLLLKDVSQNISLQRTLYTTIFAVMMVLLFLLYLLLLFKLQPLKKITKELHKFSTGDLDVNLDIEGFKEIDEVAKALQNAADSLKNIQNSRKLLLRNIMHELKTPIAKGRIQAEMVEDEKQKRRLIQIFEKLNSLINELAALEAVNSKIRPNIEPIPLKDLVDEAIHIGMFDRQELTIIQKANPTIQADYKLLAIAIKNLIDNALKHSPLAHATIILYPDRLEIQNQGEALERPIQEYLQAFYKKGNQSGFGLGLYLVDNIVRLHHFTLTHRYDKEGYHHFIISF